MSTLADGTPVVPDRRGPIRSCAWTGMKPAVVDAGCVTGHWDRRLSGPAGRGHLGGNTPRVRAGTMGDENKQG